MSDNFEIIYANIDNKIKRLKHIVDELNPIKTYGKLLSAVGTTITATMKDVKIGDMCIITEPEHDFKLYAEVVSLNKDEVRLLPFGSILEISKSAIITKVANGFTIALNDKCIGTVMDGLGEIIDYLEPNQRNLTTNLLYNENQMRYSVDRTAPGALSRPIISKQILTGVKTIDLFTSCGKGQRLAIFAGAGVGKTTMIGMILKNTKADIVVIALIGERGREVQEFIQFELDAESRKRCVLIVETSDQPPVKQVKAAYVAHTVAEYFRDQGKDVFLFIDSMTRFARAQREVGLSAGEIATRGGFPPSVFLSFPRLMERAGNSLHGSITAFYTVLVEGSDITNDPIAEEIKSIVDGHIILDRNLAQQGHFPAINILTSLSRIADRIINDEHLKATRKIRALLTKYAEVEFLIRVGEYKEGSDKLADEAIQKHDKIMKLLAQNTKDTSSFSNDVQKLIGLAK